MFDGDGFSIQIGYIYEGASIRFKPSGVCVLSLKIQFFSIMFLSFLAHSDSGER